MHPAIEIEGVSKKFRRGERHDSLRDLIPAALGRLTGRRPRDPLLLRAEEFWALDDLSLEVRPGEALGIIGPNGSGKSTLLKLLTRILRPDRGRIGVRGRLSALIEVGAGFHPELTGRENVYLNGAILGMTRADIDRRFDEIVAFAELAAVIDTPVKRYSSGMYARLGFSVAAHVDPDVLLIDEVLSVGDMPFQRRCLEKMYAFRAAGRTIVFVSHNLEAVHALCGRTALLVHGRLAALGPSREVIQTYNGHARNAEATGGGEAAFREVRLLDERGLPIDRVRPGQPLQIAFGLDTALPLDECLMAFIVERVEDGLWVCDYNLPLDVLRPRPAGPSPVPGVLRFEANLLRGAYAISLLVYHTKTARVVGGLRNGVVLAVTELDSYQGIAHLEPALAPGTEMAGVEAA